MEAGLGCQVGRGINQFSFIKINEMSEDVSRSGGQHPGGYIGIGSPCDVAERRRAAGHCREDHLLARLAVADQPVKAGRRIGDLRAMGGEEPAASDCLQSVRCGAKVGDAAIGGRHQRRRPGHDVIAGQKRATGVERQVPCEVARGVQGGERPGFTLDTAAFAQLLVRHEVPVDAFTPCDRFGQGQFLHQGRAPGGGRPESRHLRARCGDKARRQGRVIEVSVGDQDIGDRLAPGRVKDGGQMGVAVGAGIDIGPGLGARMLRRPGSSSVTAPGGGAEAVSVIVSFSRQSTRIEFWHDRTDPESLYAQFAVRARRADRCPAGWHHPSRDVHRFHPGFWATSCSLS